MTNRFAQLKQPTHHHLFASSSRWWNGEIWTSFFTEFLNIRSADELPDLAEWLVRFQDFFFASKMAQWSEIHGIIKSALRR